MMNPINSLRGEAHPYDVPPTLEVQYDDEYNQFVRVIGTSETPDTYSSNTLDALLRAGINPQKMSFPSANRPLDAISELTSAETFINDTNK